MSEGYHRRPHVEETQDDDRLGFAMLLTVVALVVVTVLAWFWTHRSPVGDGATSITVRPVTSGGRQ